MVKNMDELIEVIATQDKTATLTVWPNAIFCRTRAEEYLKEHKNVGRRCYLGEQLIMPQYPFMYLFSHRSSKLTRAIQTIMESGIYSIWYRQLLGLTVSAKVQKRSRFITPTKLLEEPELPEALKLLDGKLKSVFHSLDELSFLLWRNPTNRDNLGYQRQKIYSKHRKNPFCYNNNNSIDFCHQ